MLNDLAKTAFTVGETNKAGVYAERMLQESQSGKKDWNLGNNIFFGNFILGRLALKAGDVERAKHYLIEAGQDAGFAAARFFRSEHDAGEGIIGEGREGRGPRIL